MIAGGTLAWRAGRSRRLLGCRPRVAGLAGRPAAACWTRGRSPGCTGRCARAARTPRTSLAPPTSTTARWRCAAAPGLAATGQSGAASRGRVERAILTAYWLVSGYGLRAWRAVAWLAVVTALLALAFHLVGFAVPPRPVSYWTSLLYAFRATLSLTDNQVTLTAWGQLLQAVLRLTGPVLLGLALLALRGRVKR